MTHHPNPRDMSCPRPGPITASCSSPHGGGGRLMRGLIEGLLLPAFRDLSESGEHAIPHDSAVLEINGQRLAFTTDSFVINPLFFPGGDIGSLAVYGTINDLAMAGAEPLYLSCGLILRKVHRWRS